MQLAVNLLATFKMIAGAGVICLDLPEGSCVQDAVEAVMQRYPVLRPHWFNTRGEMHAHVHVFLNGADCSTLQRGLQTVLRSADEVDVIPPVAGG